MPCISMYISDGLFRKDLMGHLLKQIKDISWEDKNYEIKSRNYIEIKNKKLKDKMRIKIKVPGILLFNVRQKPIMFISISIKMLLPYWSWIDFVRTT